jgi:hypothetical protein
VIEFPRNNSTHAEQRLNLISNEITMQGDRHAIREMHWTRQGTTKQDQGTISTNSGNQEFLHQLNTLAITGVELLGRSIYGHPFNGKAKLKPTQNAMARPGERAKSTKIPPEKRETGRNKSSNKSRGRQQKRLYFTAPLSISETRKSGNIRASCK